MTPASHRANLPGMDDTSPRDGRCAWAQQSPAMQAYHDDEWGVPSHDDRHLFEMLTLEGAQAGLSWATILTRREGYRRAFADFDPATVAAFSDAQLDSLRQDEGIIRNRLKIASVRTNAQALLRLQQDEGSFASYLWRWTDGRRLVHHPASPADVAPTSALSDRVSRDLKRRGFTFVGSTIVQSFLQATGVVDDHLVTCPAKRDTTTAF